jgi:hypothetical protein
MPKRGLVGVFMRIRPQTVFSFLVLLFFAFVIWGAKDWPVKAQLYPWVIGIPMLVLAALHLVMDFKEGSGKSTSPATPANAPGTTPADFQFTKGIDPVLARQRTINIFSWIFGFLRPTLQGPRRPTSSSRKASTPSWPGSGRSISFRGFSVSSWHAGSPVFP